MDSMFYECSSLESIDLSNIDTSSVTEMISMFYYCSSLKSIDLSSFDTSSVIEMDSMFYGCNYLNYIDLTNFNMINCNSYSNIFSNVNNIIYINLYYFKNDKIISDTFNGNSNEFFVCQKNNIITNTKAYNCCDFNFEANQCKSNLISETDEEPERIVQSKESSSQISIGIIIGVIAGILVFIGIILSL